MRDEASEIKANRESSDSTAGAIILKISHGYEVQEKNDPFVELADRAVDQFSLSTSPGAFLVDFIPSLAKLPDWVPGSGFKRIAEAWSGTLDETAQKPFDFVKSGIHDGTALPSYTQALLEDKEVSVDEEFDIKWSATSLYTGGADTVSISTRDSSQPAYMSLDRLCYLCPLRCSCSSP